MKIGFKATRDFYCRDHKFEIGKTYELPGTPIPCEYGFHYCVKPIDVLGYYPIQNDFHLLEIEDIGISIYHEDKIATNKLRVVREIPKEEYYELFGMINNELTINGLNGIWVKHKYDQNNNLIYLENSYGAWLKYEYDERNNLTYIEDSSGYHSIRTYDQNNNVTSYFSYHKQKDRK